MLPLYWLVYTIILAYDYLIAFGNWIKIIAVLLRVDNEIYVLIELDKCNPMLLLLLHFTAAFHTTKHESLLKCYTRLMVQLKGGSAPILMIEFK